MSKLLDRYFKENFFIIPIRKNDKRPLYKKWNQYSLSYMETRQFLKECYNIGVVAKDMWILDFDRKESVANHLEWYREYGTWIQFTPHGYHVYLKASDIEEIKLVYGERLDKVQTVRHGDMYALLAPSKVDGKSYWWLDSMKGEILRL